MRTRAWAMKTLNTQLASWTHLRHDTILYAKQSYTEGGACLYPKGFVEPRVEFWHRLKSMAGRAAELIGGLNYEGTYTFLSERLPVIDPATGEIIDAGEPVTNIVNLATIQEKQVAHLRSFATVAQRLEGMAQKELAQECFTAPEEQFIRDLIQILTPGRGSGGLRTYSGWYPQLFYRAIYQVDFRDFHTKYGAESIDSLVADVHTDVPCGDCGGDPGSVLHEAVGRVNLLLLAVDNGGDRFICAGPVLSHYELEVIGDPRRLNDEEWQKIMDNQSFPTDTAPKRFEGLTPPPWTRSYLVPRGP